MTIGDRLLKLRKERNLSQEELANVLDVSRQTISKWETNQSMPDFDKIVPLCNYFNITTDELLTGKENIVEANSINVKSNFARNIAIAVALYIMSLVAIIIFSAQFDQPIIGVSLFFTLIAIATGLLIYNGIYYKKESKEKKQNTLVKQATGIVDTLALIAYLLVSFLTGAWHITWIIFIIGGLLEQIVKLLLTVKDKNNETNGSEENE